MSGPGDAARMPAAAALRCAEILQTCQYANIASCHNHQPWNTPATAVADEHLNIYWSSWVRAQHSVNIHANPAVFLTFYDSTRPRGSNNQRCLYLRCKAAEVADAQVAERAHRLIYPDEAADLSAFLGAGLKRFYQARPLQAWVNVLSEKQLRADTLKMREEVPLAGIMQALSLEAGDTMP